MLYVCTPPYQLFTQADRSTTLDRNSEKYLQGVLDNTVLLMLTVIKWFVEGAIKFSKPILDTVTMPVTGTFVHLMALLAEHIWEILSYQQLL